MDSSGPNSTIITIFLIIFLIILNGFWTSIYTALISLKHQNLRDRLEEESDQKSAQLLKISSDQARLMQVDDFVDHVISLMTIIFIVVVLRDKLTNYLHSNGFFADFLLFLLIVIIFVIIKTIFAKKIPQRIGVRNPYALASKTIGFTKFILAFNTPFIKIINSITDFFMNIFGIESKIIEKEVTSEQIKSIVQVGENQGILGPLESKMINSIMSFDDVLAEEVMTARTEVFMIDINDKQRKYLDEFTKLKHSRIPVYKDEIDNILGVVYTKDYLLKATEVGLKNVNIKEILRPAHFVPDKIETDKLFQEMQRNHIHMSLLIDEYGGFSGIVTMEDLIEEIVGDLDDLFDKDMPDIRKTKKGIYMVKGSTSVKDLNEKVDIGIDEEDENYDTVGGFLINQLGFVPNDGDTNSIIYNGYELKILYVEERRIKAVRIRKIKEKKEVVKENTDIDKKEENK